MRTGLINCLPLPFEIFGSVTVLTYTDIDKDGKNRQTAFQTALAIFWTFMGMERGGARWVEGSTVWSRVLGR